MAAIETLIFQIILILQVGCSFWLLSMEDDDGWKAANFLLFLTGGFAVLLLIVQGYISTTHLWAMSILGTFVATHWIYKAMSLENLLRFVLSIVVLLVPAIILIFYWELLQISVAHLGADRMELLVIIGLSLVGFLTLTYKGHSTRDRWFDIFRGVIAFMGFEAVLLLLITPIENVWVVAASVGLTALAMMLSPYIYRFLFSSR